MATNTSQSRGEQKISMAVAIIILGVIVAFVALMIAQSYFSAKSMERFDKKMENIDRSGERETDRIWEEHHREMDRIDRMFD